MLFSTLIVASSMFAADCSNGNCHSVREAVVRPVATVVAVVRSEGPAERVAAKAVNRSAGALKRALRIVRHPLQAIRNR